MTKEGEPASTEPVEKPPTLDSIRSWLARIWFTEKHARKPGVVGCGIVVDSDEWLVVTCAHVVARAVGGDEYASEAPARWLEIDFPLRDPGGAVVRYPAYVAYWSPRAALGGGDMAWLALDAKLPPDIRAAPMATKEPHTGRLRIFGFTRGSPQGDWTTAKLAGTNSFGWLQLDPIRNTGRRVQMGFSGAPVWSEDAHGVVGMVVAADQQEIVGSTDGVSYAIPINVMQAKLRKLAEEHARSRLPPPSIEVDAGDDAVLQSVLNRLRVARRTVAQATFSTDGARAALFVLPQILKQLRSIEAAIADSPSTDEAVLTVQRVCHQARVWHGQVQTCLQGPRPPAECSPHVDRLLAALVEVERVALDSQG
jgi:Trypsin-like peptidase domain